MPTIEELKKRAQRRLEWLWQNKGGIWDRLGDPGGLGRFLYEGWNSTRYGASPKILAIMQKVPLVGLILLRKYLRAGGNAGRGTVAMEDRILWDQKQREERPAIR